MKEADLPDLARLTQPTSAPGVSHLEPSYPTDFVAKLGRTQVQTRRHGELAHRCNLEN